MFPKLTAEQLARLDSFGQRARTSESEILIESGERYRRIVAVISGSLDVVMPGVAGETPITHLTGGDFTGEMSALRGSSSFVRTRVREAGEVISIPVENLRRLIQTDAELSELFMRAFILRRMALQETHQGDVVLIGSDDSPHTLREIFPAPRSWVEVAYPGLAYYSAAERGGHFAAWEEPALFTSELRAAFKPLRR
jgi:thioredoxin reductase (NADPH)